MAKEKKRMSKNAKAALKLLNDSKLLAAAKTVTDAKADQNFKPAEAPVKPTGAN
jgi:hypothetical protein